MKKLPGGRGRILSLGFAFGLIMSSAGCAKTINFETSTVEPAAVGKVKLKKDNNRNYSVDVSVMHLANPQRLTPPMDKYVVWVETGTDEIKNIGRINISTGTFTRTLKGSLKTVTVHAPARVFITAEPAGDISHPGTPVVLTTEKF
ncbi:MAG TPA: hypothetical protein VHE54_05460 [Puia sp.]|nr:hypothetical protein [Puia sp.]